MKQNPISGPWGVNQPHASRSNSRQVLTTDGFVIAELPGWMGRNIDRCADLIAAAPDLMAAIKPLAFSSPDHPPPDIDLQAWHEAVMAARAALSRAQGQSGRRQ